MPAESLEDVVSLCKRRGFIFPGSAIYGGLANSWDYGPLGIELKNNLKRAWWRDVVYRRDDMEGLDAALIMNPKVWHYSGHEATFNDPLVDNRVSKHRYRLDHLLRSQSLETLRQLLSELLRLTSSNDFSGSKSSSFLSLLAFLKGSDLSEQEQEEVCELALKLQSAALPEEAEFKGERFEGIVSSFCCDFPEFGSLALNQAKIVDPTTNEPGEWTEPRPFNLMFETFVGPIKSEEHKAYLRPETAQGIFVNFKHILDTMRHKLPFGIAQIGKSFRNEVTPGNFTFRTREFEQMEIEYFVKPGEDEEAHRSWVDTRYNWYLDYGIAAERLNKREQGSEELAHYAKACVDLEYKFPGSLGFSELEGIANRTDFDLAMHSKSSELVQPVQAKHGLEKNAHSLDELSYFDPESRERFIPYVIEPSAGADRATLAFLCEAYNVEQIKDIPEAQESQVSDQLKAFSKSVEKNKELAEDLKQRLFNKAAEILDGGPKAFPAIASLLSLKGADAIVLGKKLRNLYERLVDQYYRRVLKLDARLAPIKVAIFPLKRNASELVTKAHEIKAMLSKHDFRVLYDDTGAIGKLYRRQDEIGTPFCVTVDFQSLEDGSVTLRERDSMEQTRIAVDQLEARIRSSLNI